MERWFYTNAAIFPAVNSRHSGIRFTLHHHLQMEDIEDLFAAIAEELPKALKKYGISRQQLDAAFDLKSAQVSDDKVSAVGLVEPQKPKESELHLQHANTIAELNQPEWDSLLGSRGNFDSKTLLTLEKTFADQTDAINHWQFHYFVIRDQAGKVVLMTFFTEALLKSDMLTAEAKVSKTIEAVRQKDPLYLTATVFLMGSPITEGNHLYLDMHGAWREVLTLLLNEVEEIRRAKDIKSVVFRDIDAGQENVITFLKGFDFLALPLPNSWKIDVDWQTEEQYLQNLSKNQRRFQKNKVQPFDKMWRLNVLDKDQITEQEWQKIYQLYLNVQQKALTLNSFALPLSFFQNILKNPDWEMWTLSFQSENKFRGFSLNQKNGEHYIALVLGLDYDYVLTHGLYRQILSRNIKRGKELGCTMINLGLGTDFEKNRHGAKRNEIVMLVQSFDQYQNEVIETHRVNQNGV